MKLKLRTHRFDNFPRGKNCMMYDN